MDEAAYARYVSLVEAKQQRKAAEIFFDPGFTVFKDGHEYSDIEAFLRVKDFQYNYMRETIEVLSFYKGSHGFAVETMYGWHADKDIPKEDFEREGCPQAYVPLKKGESKRTHCVFFYETHGQTFTRVRVFELGE